MVLIYSTCKSIWLSMEWNVYSFKMISYIKIQLLRIVVRLLNTLIHDILHVAMIWCETESFTQMFINGIDHNFNAWKKMKAIVLLNRDTPTEMLTWCDHIKGGFKAIPGCSLAIVTDVKYKVSVRFNKQAN